MALMPESTVSAEDLTALYVGHLLVFEKNTTLSLEVYLFVMPESLAAQGFSRFPYFAFVTLFSHNPFVMEIFGLKDADTRNRNGIGV